MCLCEIARARIRACCVYARLDFSTVCPMTNHFILLWCGYSACGYYYNNVSIYFIHVQLRVNVIFFFSSFLSKRHSSLEHVSIFSTEIDRIFRCNFFHFILVFVHIPTHTLPLLFATYLSIDGFVFLFLSFWK